MRLTVIGGGGFRVPLVYGELLRRMPGLAVDEVVLFDPDCARAELMADLLGQMPTDGGHRPRVVVSADQVSAVSGADFLFVAARPGGTAGRVHDERVALAAGVLGQETTGPGGIGFGLRSVPAMVELARVVSRHAPSAWVINFTNPVSMVTEAMSRELGDRVIGICDSPLALCRRVARALGVPASTIWFDYFGLNHLGWLRRAVVDGQDRLPDLLADTDALAQLEEGALFGAEWCRTLGMIPNEYLHYFYNADDAVTAIRAAPRTRGEFLLEQQADFYAAAAARPEQAFDLWSAARRQRDATYMAEARHAAGYGDRHLDDVAGGYEGVALDLMTAISSDARSVHILNVRNRGAVQSLDTEAVVEVPCLVDRTGAHPLVVGSVPDHAIGLMKIVKAVERDTIAAALTKDRERAWRALALHPLVPSVVTAKQILEGYWPRPGEEAATSQPTEVRQ